MKEAIRVLDNAKEPKEHIDDDEQSRNDDHDEDDD